MAKKLVIVESPAKAKTIGSFLGSDYEVQASIGHIRDLVPNSKGLPEDLRKKWWSDFAVNVEEDFKPFYEVPKDKKAQVDKLKNALKGKEELVLATDEDREGEAISWHLLQVLKPAKTVKVKRIAFHEITPNAIREALAHPRDVDEDLVEAQEARRILDRLYGYTLSPVLWSRVEKNLSAGRVQSPAVKLIVERELLRRNFHAASYWNLKAEFRADSGTFPADLRAIDDVRVATGNDFDDSTGELKATRGDKVIRVDEARARALADQARPARPYKVERIETAEATEKPAPPFMTTTLQQDANRKFGFSADRTMRIAQSLYEGVDIGGEQVGLITYMRTDSLTLSKEALDRIRGLIQRDYPDCLPEKPQQYTSKVRNAQEAHEAIRPTDSNRKPQDMARFLNEDQQRLYQLIWQRTVASQMKPARVLKTEADIAVDAGGEKLTFHATGKQVLFDGFHRVYTEGRDDDQEPKDRKLPKLEKGMEVEPLSIDPAGHQTKPPARYTDATLIRKLEEQGIGRPSTYASIIQVIVDRGYVRKQGKQLIPTFRAFLTMEVLENNFQELMDLGFTARMDEELDRISEGHEDSKRYLREFFLGADGKPGLWKMVSDRKGQIPYPAFVVGDHPETGEQILVRLGKTSNPFLQIGGEGNRRYKTLPEDLAPADLTIDKAVELLSQQNQEPESVGLCTTKGRRLLLRFRNGPYLEMERTPEEIDEGVPPTWVSIPPGVDPRQIPQDDLDYLCSLPREIGKHPETGDPITFKVGRFGAYVESGSQRRNAPDWRAAGAMTVEDAVALLSQGPGQQATAAQRTIKELGNLEGAAGPVKVLNGRYGPYVTDGETNATLPKGTDPEQVSPEEALRLLIAKKEAGPTKRPFKKKASRKTAGTKRK